MIGLKVQWELTKPLFMLIHDFFGPEPILVRWFRAWSKDTSTPTIVFETKLSPPEYAESSLAIVPKSWKSVSVKRFSTLSCWQIIACYRCVQKCPDTWPSLHRLEFVSMSIWCFYVLHTMTPTTTSLCCQLLSVCTYLRVRLVKTYRKIM